MVEKYTDSSAGCGVHRRHVKTTVGTTARGHNSIEEYSTQVSIYNTTLTLQTGRDAVETGRVPDRHREDDGPQQLVGLCQADFF